MSSFSNPLTEYSPQMELEYPPAEWERQAAVFDEDREMELASRLLGVSGEQELDYFLGDLIKSAGNALGAIVKSPIGQAIGGVLKKAAGVALPLAGTALGGMVGGPLGAQIGSGLASMAGHALGLELEGLSAEDREFESARQFVRFAGETVRQALAAAPGADPPAVANAAVRGAARTYAPGLIAGEAEFGRPFDSRRRATSQDRRRHMHDIDRTQFGFGHEVAMEAYPPAGENETLTEDEVMEYAANLMELETEEEFENFLGDIIGTVASAAGSLIPGPAGQALGGLLKGAAKKLLPMAGQALGGWVGGPMGARLGGQLGSYAASSEAESNEAEWEAAKKYVRFAAQAARNLAQSGGEEYQVTPAVTSAAQTQAPDLLAAQGGKPPMGAPGGQPPAPPPASLKGGQAPTAQAGCHCGGHHHGRHQAGHWIRHGREIVLYGI